ncbi:MAG: exopolysaccharide biosynthesis protein [Rhizomicrobium sp.]
MQTSQALARLLDEAPTDRISAGWIAEHLKDRSFGFVMLVLAIAGLVPGIASVSGFLLAVPALQMIAGRHVLALPRALAERSIATAGFARWMRRLIPFFARLERIFPSGAGERVQQFTRFIGAVDLCLALAIIVPVPFAYVPPTLAIALISFAQIEDSFILLAIALGAAFIAILFVAFVSAAVLKLVLAATGL